MSSAPSRVSAADADSTPSLASLSLHTLHSEQADVDSKRPLINGQDGQGGPAKAARQYRELRNCTGVCLWSGATGGNGLPVGDGVLFMDRQKDDKGGSVRFMDEPPSFGWGIGSFRVEGTFKDGELEGQCSVAMFPDAVTDDKAYRRLRARRILYHEYDSVPDRDPLYTATCVYASGSPISVRLTFEERMHAASAELMDDEVLLVRMGVLSASRRNRKANPEHDAFIDRAKQRDADIRVVASAYSRDRLREAKRSPPRFLSGPATVETSSGTFFFHFEEHYPDWSVTYPGNFHVAWRLGFVGRWLSRKEQWSFKGSADSPIASIMSHRGDPTRARVVYRNGSEYDGDYTPVAGRYGYGVTTTEAGVTRSGFEVAGQPAGLTVDENGEIFVLGEASTNTQTAEEEAKRAAYVAKLAWQQSHPDLSSEGDLGSSPSREKRGMFELDASIARPVMQMFQTTDASKLGVGRDVQEPCASRALEEGDSEEETYNESLYDVRALRPVAIYKINNASNVERYTRRREERTRLKYLKCPGDLVGARKDKPFEGVDLDGGPLQADKNEKILFHGTSWETAASIAQNGFDVSYANAGLYGRGIYFADDVAKTDQYAKSMKESEMPPLGLPARLPSLGLDSSVSLQSRGLACDGGASTSFYPMIVSRVTLGCAAIVTSKTFGYNRTIYDEKIFSSFPVGFLPTYALGRGSLWNMPWNSVVTHHDNKVFTGHTSSPVNKFRYREFIIHDDVLALPLYVVCYSRFSTPDPGAHMRGFANEDRAMSDPLFCPMPDLPDPLTLTLGW